MNKLCNDKHSFKVVMSREQREPLMAIKKQNEKEQWLGTSNSKLNIMICAVQLVLNQLDGETQHVVLFTL